MPILSMLWRKLPETEAPDLQIASEEWQVPMKRVKSTCIKTRAGNRQLVCNNKFEAIAEQNHDKKTKKRWKYSEVCGGCEEGRGEKQIGSEDGSEDTEGWKKDPNLVEILLSGSVASEPLCEMANECGRPCRCRNSHTEDAVSVTQDCGIRRVQARCKPHDGRRQHCGKRRRENADHVNSRWSTIAESDFPSGKRQQGTWVSLEDGEERKPSGVRHVRVTRREQDEERHTVAPRNRWSVRCGHMVAPPGREQTSKPPFGKRCM